MENPEDHVLAQYLLPDPTKAPIPVEYDDSLAAGVLMLYPEAELAETGRTPMSGGIVGTIRSIFRVLGFLIVPPTEEEQPQSQTVAKTRGGTGLYGKRNAKSS